MRKYLGSFIVLFVLMLNLFAQSRKDIEKQITKTKNEIALTNKLLKETEKSKNQTITKLQLLNRKIELRKEYINSLTSEIAYLTEKSEKTMAQVGSLRNDIKVLKDEYAKVIYYAYKNRNSYDRIMFILSSEDFNQAYKRIRYLQMYSEYRKFQVQHILKKTKQLNDIIISYNNTIKEKSQLVDSKKEETAALSDESSQQTLVVKDLESRQNELKENLEEKIKIAEKLKKEIERIIAEEQKKYEEKRKALAAEKAAKAKEVATAAKANSKTNKYGQKETPAAVVAIVPNQDVILTGKFNENIGKLPWPTADGVVTQSFGEHSHPLFPTIKTTNNGIDISASKGAQARSVYEGEVTKIIVIPGANTSVLIRHGNYVSVYSNLKDVFIKLGQKVSTKQAIGTIYTDEETGNTTMNFQIWKETTKLDPQKCLSK